MTKKVSVEHRFRYLATPHLIILQFKRDILRVIIQHLKCDVCDLKGLSRMFQSFSRNHSCDDFCFICFAILIRNNFPLNLTWISNKKIPIYGKNWFVLCSRYKFENLSSRRFVCCYWIWGKNLINDQLEIYSIRLVLARIDSFH